MPKKKLSPAIQLLDLVWGECNQSTAFSWERLNHGMYQALKLAVGSGMAFHVGDFAAIYDRFNAGRWIGDDEWVYRLAVMVENKSAIEAFEAHKGRGPFIADDVDFGNCYDDGGYLHGQAGRRATSRLAVGFRFPWKGETVTVTSMPRGDGPVIACSYREGGVDAYPRKILHRYKITAADIKADRAERKEREKIVDRAAQLPNGDEFVKILGVTTMQQLNRVPLKTLRKVLEELESAVSDPVA